MEKAETNIARPFVIPDYLILADPEEMYPLLLETVKEFKVNIFRTRVHYHPGEQVEIQKYVLLTGETRFFDAFSLKTGRFLTPEDMQGMYFLSTIESGDPNQIGVIKSFGESLYVTIRPLKISYDYLPVAGRYYVEAPNPVTYSAFLEGLAQNVKKYDPSYTFAARDFKEVPSEEGGAKELASNVTYLRGANIIIIIIVLVLLLYYIFNESKQIGIMKMHGISNFRLWYLLVGRLILLWFIPLAFLFLLAALLIRNTTLPFVFGVFLSLSQNFALFLAVTFLTYFYFKHISVKDVIKEKKDTRAIFALNLLLKVAFSVLLILASLATLHDYRLVRIKQENLKHWEYAKDYGVFYPITIYETFQSDEEYRNYERNLHRALDELYFILNRKGALLIDTRSYEEISLISNKDYMGIRCIKVNPNYLRAFPIYDKDGKAVEVTEDTVDLVLLVPEKYRAKEREIVAFFANRKCEYGVPEPEVAAPERFKEQTIKIIWLKNNQKIFSFNPAVFPRENNIINDPIIQVVTKQNSTLCDRRSILGGGATDPLKVKLIDRDPKRTCELLKPYLRQLGLERNLQHLVVVHQVFLDEIYSLQRKVQGLTLLSTALLVVLVILVAQNLVIFFSKYQLRFVIERIFGISFFRTYRAYFLIFAALWVLQLLLSASIAKRFDLMLLFVAAVLAAVEFVGSVVALVIIERRNKIKVVKGGF